MQRIGDIEDADAKHALRTYAVLYALGAAVQPASGVLRRDEQQLPIDGDVALLRETQIGRGQRGVQRIGDVPDLESAEVPLIEIVAAESQVGIRVRQAPRLVGMKYVRLVAVGHELETFRGDTGVVQAWLGNNTRGL